MPARSIDKKVFDDLMNAFRERPGNAPFAARVAGVSPVFARKAWRGDIQMWPVFGGLSIQEHLELEAENAALARKKQTATEEQIRTGIRLQVEADKARELEDEARKVNEATIRAARSVVLHGYTGLARVTEGINKLAERVGGQLARGTDHLGNPIVIDAMEALKILQRYAQSVNTLTNALDTLTAMERVKQNLPTAILGIDIQNITLEDAERELETAKDAVSRAKDLGLVVHSGGRK